MAAFCYDISVLNWACPPNGQQYWYNAGNNFGIQLSDPDCPQTLPRYYIETQFQLILWRLFQVI